jgi:flagellar assembly factor FliW
LGIRIKTKPFGEMEIDERQIVEFPEGILGFDYIRKFILLDADDPDSPFKWLQAFDEPRLAFVVIRPVDFMGSYELSVSQSELEAVECGKPESLLVFAIVTIPENPSLMTANLQGPIIINAEKKLGRQAISMNDRYHVRHRILDEMKKTSQTGG